MSVLIASWCAAVREASAQRFANEATQLEAELGRLNTDLTLAQGGEQPLQEAVEALRHQADALATRREALHAQVDAAGQARRRRAATALATARGIVDGHDHDVDREQLEAAEQFLGLSLMEDRSLREVERSLAGSDQPDRDRRRMVHLVNKAAEQVAGSLELLNEVRGLGQSLTTAAGEIERIRERLRRDHSVSTGVLDALGALPSANLALFVDQFLRPRLNDARLEVNWGLALDVLAEIRHG